MKYIRNYMRRSKKDILINIITVFLFLVLLCFYIFRNSNNIDKVLEFCGWLIFIWTLICLNILNYNLFSPITVFTVVMYIFTMSQSLLHILGVSPPIYILNITERTNYTLCLYYTLIGMLSFLLGVINVKKANKDYGNAENKEKMAKSMEQVGLGFTIISTPSFLYDLTQTMKVATTQGYRAIYGYDTFTGMSRGVSIERIFSVFGHLFLPGLICVYIAVINNKRKKLVIYLIVVIYCIVYLIIGKRGKVIVCLAVFFIIANVNKDRVNISFFIKLVIIGYIGASFITIIGELRNASGFKLNEYVNAFLLSFGKENLALEAIASQGTSMYPLSAVLKLIPADYPFAYTYGTTYLWAFTSLIPNLGFWDIHPVMIYSEGQSWLMSALNVSYGPGFNIIAESYRNFGILFFIPMFVWGFMLAKIFSNVNKEMFTNRPDLICVIMLFFSYVLMVPREDFQVLIRPCFFVILPMYAIIRYFYKRK